MLFGEKMNLTDELVLPRTGKVLKNRTVLAAMTNKQSHENGILSEEEKKWLIRSCLLYTSPSPRDRTRSRMPSSA